MINIAEGNCHGLPTSRGPWVWKFPWEIGLLPGSVDWAAGNAQISYGNWEGKHHFFGHQPFLILQEVGISLINFILPNRISTLPLFYPLVNCYITMEHHHFWWVNQVFLWPCSIANCWHNQKVPPCVSWWTPWVPTSDQAFVQALKDGKQRPGCVAGRGRQWRFRRFCGFNILGTLW